MYQLLSEGKKLMNKAVIVFTGKSATRILREGGTSEWVLDANRAADADFAICTRSGIDWREGHEPQGSAFLVGKISSVVEAPTPGRYLIRFSEYALVSIPDVWQGWRNPVHYGTLEDFNIDPAQLDFKLMSAVDLAEDEHPPSEQVGDSHPLTIEQAKAGLSITFGVAPSQIEITIRA
jgi:hypothetical protein